VLATPYVFTYDLVVLAIPAAFLMRLALQTGFRKAELYALVVSGGLLVSFCVVTVPVGFVAALVLAGVIIDRAVAELSPVRPPDAVSSRA